MDGGVGYLGSGDGMTGDGSLLLCSDVGLRDLVDEGVGYLGSGDWVTGDGSLLLC